MTLRFEDLSADEQRGGLTELAHLVLMHYPIDVASLDLVNHGFNTTFKVYGNDEKAYALRINVNSRRTAANVAAETAWVAALRHSDVTVANIVTTKEGSGSVQVFSDLLGRETSAVLFEWLPGSMVAALDDPTEALRESGRLLARLHLAGATFALPDGAELPLLDDIFWGFDNVLTGPRSQLSGEDQALFGQAIDRISSLVASVYASGAPQIIHADVHAGNMIWHDGTLSIIDFDDCGIGFPLQDIAVSLSYLPDPAFRSVVLDAYQEVAPLPDFNPADLFTLVLQRRLQLLNFFAGSQNAEHRGMFERFLVGARTQVEAFLAN